eukprot:COSAG05_NODE_19244_length_295_cov_1.321429_1_plen_32_part_01
MDGFMTVRDVKWARTPRFSSGIDRRIRAATIA